MDRHTGRSAAAALVALALAGPLAAADAKFGVKDDAKFFSQAAVERTTQRLGQMAKSYNVNFRIESVVLSDAEQAKAGKTKDEQDKYVKSLATKRFSELGLGPQDGIILIVRKPSYVQAHFGTAATSSYFNEANGKKLASQIASDLTATKGGGSRDGALDNALSTLNDGAFKMTAPPRPGPKAAAPQAGGGTTVDSVKKTSSEVVDNAKKDIAKGKDAVQGMSTSTLIILGVVVALVLLFALKGLFGGGSSRPAGGYAPPPPGNYGTPGSGGQGMNQPMNYGRPPAPPPQGYPPPGGYPQQGYPQGGQQPPQGGGGGFMKGVLGGMLGGAAGAYMYEKMSGPHAQGGTPTGGGYAGGGGGGAGTTGGGDYSATGDFGDAPAASGGGDYGAGGDFGGDDAASGGDYGAGGDFSNESGGGDYGAGGDFGGDSGGDDAGGGGDFGGDDDS